MTGARIGVGIVGAGPISDLHAIEYLRADDAAIAALSDRDSALRAARGDAWTVPTERRFADLNDLFDCAAVDIVEILLPHDLHARATLAALAAGKAVSVQKPMATTVADARAMVEAGGRPGAVLKVFETFVFYPPVQKARQLLEEGAVGEPLTIRIKSVVGDPRHGWAIPRQPAPRGSTRLAAAAVRSSSTTATTSSRWPGG